MGALIILMVGGLLLTLGLDGGDSDDDTDRSGDEIYRDEDTIYGTDGDDVISGSDDPEQIMTGNGNDYVRAGADSDIIVDGDGQSYSTGDDTLYGGDGDDDIYATGGTDELYGGRNDDFLIAVDFDPQAAFAPDQINGGWGEDTLVGDDGDSLTGGVGTDIFVTGVLDSGSEEIVTIEDFEPGESILIEVYDNDLIPADATTVGETRDTDDGAVISIEGHDVLLVRGILASQIAAGTVQIIDYSGDSAT